MALRKTSARFLAVTKTMAGHSRWAKKELVKLVPAADNVDGSGAVLLDDQLLSRFHTPHQLASLLASTLQRPDLSEDPRTLRKLEDKIRVRLLSFSHLELSDLLSCYARHGNDVGADLATELWSIISDELEYMDAHLSAGIMTRALLTCGRHVSVGDHQWDALSLKVPQLEPRDLINLAAAIGRLYCPDEFIRILRDRAAVLAAEGRLDHYQQVQLALSTGSPLPSDCTVAPWTQLVAAVAWGLPLPGGSSETAGAASLRSTPKQAQDALWGYVGVCETTGEVGDSDLAAVLHRRSEAAEWADPLVKFQTVVGIRGLWGVDLGGLAEAPPDRSYLGVPDLPTADGWHSRSILAGYGVDTYNADKGIAGDLLRRSEPEARAFARIKRVQVKRLTRVTLESFRLPAELLQWRAAA
ncbi:hypothetical protein FOZ60_011830 [Perkinsus olseni]|uniref:Uncharacterized protein n=1 Tax=Perkinsus olseni TaxID=32597 RepID=A0A7J6PMM7_PEROL|nr:hypothetical protein FOZ60_011830 [Perkinsus olseni]